MLKQLSKKSSLSWVDGLPTSVHTVVGDRDLQPFIGAIRGGRVDVYFAWLELRQYCHVSVS